MTLLGRVLWALVGLVMAAGIWVLGYDMAAVAFGGAP